MEKLKTKLCIIDADSMLYLVCIANTLEDNFSAHKKSLDGFFSRIVAETGADYYLPCLSKTSYKKKLFPDYKAKRVYKHIKFLAELKEYSKEKYNAIEVDGLEADDLLGILAKKFSSSYEVILSYLDKDLRQLPYPYFNYKTGEKGVITAEEARTSLLKQIIIGDSVDNIKGIEKRGEAYANKVINNSSSLLDVFQEYLKHYDEFLAVRLFYENYSLVKINDKFDLFLDTKDIKLCQGIIKWK